MDFKNTNAPLTTPTRDLLQLCQPVGNVYETIVILGKRANQINALLKKQIDESLSELTEQQEIAEEVFENIERTEISKEFEKLPKPTLIATQEFIESKLEYTSISKDDQLN